MFNSLSTDVRQSLYDWLEIVAIVHLDSALCHSIWRSILLQDLSDPWIAVNNQGISFNDSCLLWVVMRNITIVELNLVSPLTSCSIIDNELKTSKVKILQLDYQNDFKTPSIDMTISLINACPNIVSLKLIAVCIFSDKLLTQIDSSILRNLERLVLTKCYRYDTTQFTATSIIHLTSLCCNLVDFQVNLPGKGAIDVPLLRLIKQNPNLEVISVDNIANVEIILQAITTCCHAIQSVTLTTLDSTPWIAVMSGILSFISVTKSLHRLHLLTDGDTWFNYRTGVSKASINRYSGNGAMISFAVGDVKDLFGDCQTALNLWEQLYVTHLVFSDFCVVSGEMLRHLAGNNVHLKSLWLTAEYGSDPFKLHDLAHVLRTSKNVDQLELRCCNQLSNNDLIALFNETPHIITGFQLLGHEAVTTETVQTILAHNPQILKCSNLVEKQC